MAEESSNDIEKRFAPIAELMRNEGLSPLIINSFRYYYSQLLAGATGHIDSSMIQPVESLPDLESIEDSSTIGTESLKRAVVIKLNGGLGTGMGLDAAKSLLPAKQNLSFLDIVIQQVMFLRKTHKCDIPLIFMNSFRTEQDTFNALQAHPKFVEGQGGIAVSFQQNKVPKILQSDLSAVKWPKDPSHEWCPPGHGDIYISMLQSGILDQLLSKGFEYALIANSDNLGATLDPQVLGYFVKTGAPFMMEVCDRRPVDKKGGHLAAKRGGGLILREAAQCPPNEEQDFQDIHKWKYFNSNNLWVNLKALKAILTANDNIMALTLIRNSKTVDPTDDKSPKVYQLETAMGSAISCFSGAIALRVPFSRFAPVKKNDDLLTLWSDIFVIDEAFHVDRDPKRKFGELYVELDPKFYKTISAFKARFPKGVPSLIECESVIIKGDVLFGKNVVLKGKVTIKNDSDSQMVIDDNSVIIGD